MKKKIYDSPSFALMQLETESVIAASDSATNSQINDWVEDFDDPLAF